MLSSLFAGLAGVLLAPLFAQVTAPNFTILLVAAIAAAAFGRLTSIPLALVGGIAPRHRLQLLLHLAARRDSILSNGPAAVAAVRRAVPAAAVLARAAPPPGGRRPALAGVDPPPPGPGGRAADPGHDDRHPGLGVGVFVASAPCVALFVLDDFWLRSSPRR